MIWNFVIAAVSFVLSYTQAKKAQKQAKELADKMAGVLINKESNIEAVPVVYGTRRVGGTRVYMSTSQDEKHKWLYVALVLCEGEVESITNIEIDDKPYTDDNGNIIAGTEFLEPFRLVYHEVFTGRDDQASPNESNTKGGINIIKEGMYVNGQAYDTLLTYNMRLNFAVDGNGHVVDSVDDAANFRLSGLAAICLRFEWNDDYNPFGGGAPKVTALVKGKKVYDPRKDSSLYGDGNHRVFDKETWEYSDNAALCLRDYLSADRYGKNLTLAEIDDEAFIKAANDLDSFLGQDDTPLFACNAVVDTGLKLFENVQTFLLNCRGFLPYQNGKYTLKIDQKVTSPDEVLTITEDNIIGGIKIVGAQKEDRFNQVIVKFPDAALNYQPNNAIWPDPASDNPTKALKPEGGFYTEAELSAAWLAQDGERLIDEIDLDYVTDYYQARDLARLFAWRSRQTSSCAVTVDSTAIDLVCGDVVFVQHPTPMWALQAGDLAESQGYFQVDEMALKNDGTVDLKLLEFRNSFYDYDPAVPQVISNPPYAGAAYSLQNNPKRAVAELQMQTNVGWSFEGTTKDYSAFNASLTASASYVTLTPVDSDPYIKSPTFLMVGAISPIIRAKVRRLSGSQWDGALTYSTTSHGFSYATYKKRITKDPTRLNEWVIVEWDMSEVEDWVSSTITQIGVHLGQGIGDIFDIEFITVGRLGASVTQIDSSNVKVFVADSALTTPQLADNSVTVPLVDESIITYVGDGATYNKVAEVDIVVPSDNCPVTIWWSFEHAYSAAAGWRYKLMRDGVPIDQRIVTMTAINDYPTSVYFDLSDKTAGQTYTYALQWWGSNSDITLASGKLFVMAVAK